MRNPYAAPEPRDSNHIWWLLLIIVAVVTVVLALSLGKFGTHSGYAAESLESGRAAFPR